MKLNNKWFKKKWVAYCAATCSAVVLYMLLSNLPAFLRGLSALYSYIRPVVLGVVVAYIFNPLAVIFDKKIYRKMKNEKNRWRLSVASTILAIILAVVLLGVALIPQLVDSISTFISNIGNYVDSSQELIRNFETEHSEGILSDEFSGMADIVDRILESISDIFSNNVDNIVSSSVNAGKGAFDGVLAFILAIYLLLDKERLLTGVSRLMELIMKEKTYQNSGEFLGRCNRILIRYISFDIIDGIIVGVVNFIYMLIAGMPYSVLISVIVGVTNLAPTFGPIVGCVIGAFILVLVNPWYALWFIIFTIILQTIDGYVLKPKLFGGSLGVSPLMILISIILGGRFFGVVGILLAIPFAAIIDFVWNDFVIKKLEERKAKRYNI